MKKILLSLLFITNIAFAQDTMRIAVSHFYPPFVMQGANKHLYGFDISIARKICELTNHRCEYQTLPFGKIIETVSSGKADIAISAITITLNRSQYVNFSIPYMISEGSYLTHKNSKITSTSKTALANKTIGISKGSIFAEVLDLMALNNVKVEYYTGTNRMIEGLAEGDVDLVLIDHASAHYWAINSSEQLTIVGNPIKVGHGLGIAVNRNKRDLLEKINQAILTIQDSGEFKQLYKKYFEL